MTMRHLAAALALLLTVAACGTADEPTATTSPTTTTTTTQPLTTSAATSTTTTTATTTTTTTTPTTTTTLPSAEVEFAYVTAAGVAEDGTVTVTADYAQFLTGEAANAAARAAGEIGAGETVPNDYFIVNENPRLRELELDPGATILVQVCFVDGPCVVEVAVTPEQWVGLLEGEDDIPGLAAGFQWYGAGYLPYWLSLDTDGVITQVREQYLP